MNVKKFGGAKRNPRFPAYRSAAGRAVVSFEYLGLTRDQFEFSRDAQRSANHGEHGVA